LTWRQVPEANAIDSSESGTHHHRVFPARRGALSDVTAFLAGVCAAGSLPNEVQLRLTLLVEELFTNTVVHGHGGDSEAPVSLDCRVQPGRVRLTYEDAAPPYDPFADIRTPDEKAPAEERPVGGLGVLLVSTMAEQVEYRRAGDRNRVSLTVSVAR
jgi:anti-sigma regulatory factor (Ser/Thr protein kinase)